MDISRAAKLAAKLATQATALPVDPALPVGLVLKGRTKTIHGSDREVKIGAGRRCAWRKASENCWKIESNGRQLLVKVVRYFASENESGQEPFLKDAATYFNRYVKRPGDISDDLERGSGDLQRHYKIATHWNNNHKAWLLNELAKLVVRDGNRCSLEDLVEIALPYSPEDPREWQRKARR